MMKTLVLSATLLMVRFGWAQSDATEIIHGSNYYTNVIANCDQAWFCMPTSLLAYTFSTGEQTTFDASNSGIWGNPYDLDFDKEGNKWVITSAGLYKISAGQVNKMPYPLDLSDYDNRPSQIEIDNENRIVIRTANGQVYTYDQWNYNLTLIKTLFLTKYSAIATDKDDHIFYAASSNNYNLSIYAFDDSLILIAQNNNMEVQNEELYNFYIDQFGAFWATFEPIEEWGKEEYIQKSGGTITFFNDTWTTLGPDDFNMNYNPGCRKIYGDTEGNVFVRCEYASSSYKSKYIQCKYDTVNNTPLILIDSMQFEYGTLYGIDNAGKYYFNAPDCTIRENDQSIFAFNSRSSLKSDYTAIDHKNQVWLVNYYSISCFTPEKTTAYALDSVGPEGFYPHDIFVDNEDHIWFTGYKGIVEFNTSEFEYHDKSWMHIDSSDTNLKAFVKTDDGTEWVLTEDYLLKGINGNWTFIDIPLNEDVRANKILVHNGIVYIAAENMFLVYENENWKIFDNSNADISGSADIKCIAADDNGGIYFGGDYCFRYYIDDSLIHLIDLTVQDISIDPVDGRIWIIVDGALYQYFAPQYRVNIPVPGITNKTGTNLNQDVFGNLIVTSGYYDDMFIYNEEGISSYDKPDLNYPLNISPAFCRSTELNNKPQLTLYPVPASDNINFYFRLFEDGEYFVSVYDMLGNTAVQSQMIEVYAGVATNSLDIHNLPAGTYLLHVQGNDMGDTKKFTKL